MIPELCTHPLIITQFDINDESDYTFGEIRLLYSPTHGDCEIKLIHLSAVNRWVGDRTPLPVHLTGGRATLTDTGERTIQVNGNISIPRISLRVPAPPGRETRAEPPRQDLHFTLELAAPRGLAGGQKRAKGNVTFSSPEDPSAALPPNLPIKARLFKERLEDTDSTGKFRGEYFFPIVPISINGAPIQPSFKRQLNTAVELWGRAGIRLLLSEAQNPVRLDVASEVLDELVAGRPDSMREQVLSLATQQIGGMPLILLDRQPPGGGGLTFEAFPARHRAVLILCSEQVLNERLLAHEIGHALGGEHDGQRIADTWSEDLGTESVMQESNSITEKNPDKLGDKARAEAPKWALFREIPVTPLGRLDAFIKNFRLPF
jgi:hypothetical protein